MEVGFCDHFVVGSFREGRELDSSLRGGLTAVVVAGRGRGDAALLL
jgi:hypothetical protein